VDTSREELASIVAVKPKITSNGSNKNNNYKNNLIIYFGSGK
jgi:hypothetical protein